MTMLLLVLELTNGLLLNLSVNMLRASIRSRNFN